MPPPGERSSSRALECLRNLVERSLRILPVPVLEVGVAADEPLTHRAPVDLLLEPVGELPLRSVRCLHERGDVLPVQDLHGHLFCTYRKPKRPLMQRLPRVTSWSSG